MTAAVRKNVVDRWRKIAYRTFLTAQLAYKDGDYRSAASRGYYSAFQGVTGVTIARGGETQFPHGWNNPVHDQLPELIRNNGSLTLVVRRQVNRLLPILRATREDSDYRPGITVEEPDALRSLQAAATILNLLEILPYGKDAQ